MTLYILQQILSGFGHKIGIYIDRAKFPDWISQSTSNVRRSTMSSKLQPNESHNFLGIIICFHSIMTKSYGVQYSVKNIISGFTWDDTLIDYHGYGSLIVIVPSSIFPSKDGDKTIELTSNKQDIHGIHLLYKTEITMISEYDSTIVNVEDERSSALDRYPKS